MASVIHQFLEKLSFLCWSDERCLFLKAQASYWNNVYKTTSPSGIFLVCENNNVFILFYNTFIILLMRIRYCCLQQTIIVNELYVLHVHVIMNPFALHIKGLNRTFYKRLNVLYKNSVLNIKNNSSILKKTHSITRKMPTI